jgi:hypothetical protein
MTDADDVRKWLARTGYPLESEVAEAFRARGLQVFQGIHYEADKADATGAREIDVLAFSEELVRGPMTRCAVLFVIECKSSSVPWVVFRGQSPANRLGAVGHLPMNAITEVNLLAAVEFGQEPWLLRLPEDVGFRLVALATKEPALGIDRTRERDQAHATVKQVVSAAHGVLRGDPSHLPTIAVPVIVLGTRLYAVSNGEGRDEVVPSNWERILWRGDRSGEPIAIDVVSKESLPEYASLAAKGATELLPVLRGAALDAREEESRRQSPPGRADAVVRGVDSARDAVSKLVRRARHSRAKRSR